MLEIRGIWLCHMSRWDRYVLRPRIWVETPRSGTVPHIGPYNVSQLRRCIKDPIREVDHETLDLQDDLSYREYHVRILDSAERVTRHQKIRFLKVQWSHHSEKDATWEREDLLRAEYPTFLPTTSESWDEILLSGGEFSQHKFRYV